MARASHDRRQRADSAGSGLVHQGRTSTQPAEKRFAILPVSAERFGSSRWRATGRDIDPVIDAYFDPSHG
jgi:hypothetical protein